MAIDFSPGDVVRHLEHHESLIVIGYRRPEQDVMVYWWDQELSYHRWCYEERELVLILTSKITDTMLLDGNLTQEAT